jgi:hypothetical protein
VSKKEVKTYQGADRTLTFVKRYAPNPNYNGEQCTLPGGVRVDNRRFVTTSEWDYCVKRHHEFWMAEGDSDRAISDYRNEGVEGWWFPQSWVMDFAETRNVIMRKYGRHDAS